MTAAYSEADHPHAYMAKISPAPRHFAASLLVYFVARTCEVCLLLALAGGAVNGGVCM